MQIYIQKIAKTNTKTRTFRTSLYFLILFAGVFSLVQNSNAAPSVSGLIGTANHGNLITITGSEFGSHADYNNLYDTWQNEDFLNFRFNDFEQSSIIQHGFIPGANPSMSTLTTSSKHAGLQAGHFQDIVGNVDDSRVWYQTNNSGSGSIWYVTFWLRTNATDKFLRYYWNSESTSNNYYISALSNYDDGCTGSSTPWIGAGGTTWSRVENLIVWSDSTHYTSSLWEDGSLLQEARVWCSSSSRSADGHSIDIPNDTSYTSDNDYIEIDDIYIDYTRARVEIGNASTWSACTHKEIQIPTEWASGEIAFKLNRGSFGSTDLAYLYVVDADGNVNATGYPITFGQEYADRPIVSGVSAPSGTISDGNSITISGTEFGTTGPSIVLFEDYSKGSSGATLATGANSAVIGKWDSVGSANYMTYSTDYPHSGSLSLKADFTNADAESPAAITNFSGSNEIFYSYWLYIPSGFHTPGYPGTMNWKIVWLASDESFHYDDYENLKQNDTYPAALPLFGNRLGYCGINNKDGSLSYLERGVWTRFDFYLKGDPTNGTVIEREINANINHDLYSYTGEPTMCTGNTWAHLAVPGFGYQTNSAAYYDDVYLATGSGARARVEIGNASTYAASTNLAILTPTSWGNDSISATIRSGSFTSGQAYLYITDADGNVNATGYPITFGTSGGDVTAPSTPSGLSVS